jgi:hypothetical protein
MMNLEETILDILNDKYSEDIPEDTITIKGIVFTHDKSNEIHSEDISESLTGSDFCFSRKGYKNISYERWTDSTWHDWEID